MFPDPEAETIQILKIGAIEMLNSKSGLTFQRKIGYYNVVLSDS
jgi:hypothetical protein